MDRIILHCDLNSFYASVELRSRPDLQNVPVAVCGDPTSRHGIILAKNEPAKKFGVQTAETIWQAKKKCPELVLLPPHHKLYRQVSKEVNTIYEQYTDLVEPFGIDESWLDVTHTLHLFGGDAKALADHLRQRMKQEMGLTLSVGVSFNKVFAKLGSDYRKPDATTVVSRENWQRLVWPLPVGALLYVGGAARKILAQFGVKTIGELAACKRDALETLMGKMGVQLHDYANGLDTDPVRSRYEPEMVKSVGNGTTFPKNLTTAEQVRGGVAVLADSVATRLRHSGLYAGGVQVTVRDPQFHDRSRQMQLSAPTHLIRELTAAAMDLTGQLWKPPAPVRALTVTAIHLVRSEDAYEQVDLFTAGAAPKKEKQEKLEAAMDRLRGKFGTDVISYGHDNRRGKTAAPGYDPAPQRPAPLPVPGSGGPGHRPPSPGSSGVSQCRSGVLLRLRRAGDRHPSHPGADSGRRQDAVRPSVCGGWHHGAAGHPRPEGALPRRLRHSGASGRQPCPLPGPDRPGGDPLCHLQPGGPPSGAGRRLLRPLPGPLPGRGGSAVPGAAAAPGDPLRRPRLSHPLGADRSRTF